jgi:hypothetical protein
MTRRYPVPPHIAADEADQLCDISSLADAGVVSELIETRGRLRRSTARA